MKECMRVDWGVWRNVMNSSVTRYNILSSSPSMWSGNCESWMYLVSSPDSEVDSNPPSVDEDSLPFRTSELIITLYYTLLYCISILPLVELTCIRRATRHIMFWLWSIFVRRIHTFLCQRITKIYRHYFAFIERIILYVCWLCHLRPDLMWELCFGKSYEHTL